MRTSSDSQLRNGVVAAFAITRALNAVAVPSFCSSLPLNCGPPFYYFDISMFTSGVVSLSESLLAFGAAAAAIEFAIHRNYLQKSE